MLSLIEGGVKNCLILGVRLKMCSAKKRLTSIVQRFSITYDDLAVEKSQANGSLKFRKSALAMTI